MRILINYTKKFDSLNSLFHKIYVVQMKLNSVARKFSKLIISSKLLNFMVQVQRVSMPCPFSNSNTIVLIAIV